MILGNIEVFFFKCKKRGSIQNGSVPIVWIFFFLNMSFFDLSEGAFILSFRKTLMRKVNECRPNCNCLANNYANSNIFCMIIYWKEYCLNLITPVIYCQIYGFSGRYLRKWNSKHLAYKLVPFFCCPSKPELEFERAFLEFFYEAPAYTTILQNL